MHCRPGWRASRTAWPGAAAAATRAEWPRFAVPCRRRPHARGHGRHQIHGRGTHEPDVEGPVGRGSLPAPQHFQRQDAYHEARLRALADALHPFAWGVREVVFDRESLAGGTLRAQRLSVIFPDGEPYDAPGTDELPEPLLLEHLPAGVQATTIRLA